MEVFNMIAGVCSIVGLAISLFTASKVIKISQTLNCNNKDDHSRVVNKGKRNFVGGNNAGRDYVEENRGGK